ncbi:hypothetical protein IWX90DRAFT_80630 [Phyllosticta citrichinensis]|uniref:Uncharacterized protein n=1 Tax=Phyllosticta citrichinensis TaxID=1130410 RepID=A0ABR1XFV2_9PEZI
MPTPQPHHHAAVLRFLPDASLPHSQPPFLLWATDWPLAKTILNLQHVPVALSIGGMISCGGCRMGKFYNIRIAIERSHLVLFVPLFAHPCLPACSARPAGSNINMSSAERKSRHQPVRFPGACSSCGRSRPATPLLGVAGARLCRCATHSPSSRWRWREHKHQGDNLTATSTSETWSSSFFLLFQDFFHCIRSRAPPLRFDSWLWPSSHVALTVTRGSSCYTNAPTPASEPQPDASPHPLDPSPAFSAWSSRVALCTASCCFFHASNLHHQSESCSSHCG